MLSRFHPYRNVTDSQTVSMLTRDKTGLSTHSKPLIIIIIIIILLAFK